jgi:hypothetical protein
VVRVCVCVLCACVVCVCECLSCVCVCVGGVCVTRSLIFEPKILPKNVHKTFCPHTTIKSTVLIGQPER